MDTCHDMNMSNIHLPCSTSYFFTINTTCGRRRQYYDVMTRDYTVFSVSERSLEVPKKKNTTSYRGEVNCCWTEFKIKKHETTHHANNVPAFITPGCWVPHTQTRSHILNYFIHFNIILHSASGLTIFSVNIFQVKISYSFLVLISLLHAFCISLLNRFI